MQQPRKSVLFFTLLILLLLFWIRHAESIGVNLRTNMTHLMNTTRIHASILENGFDHVRLIGNNCYIINDFHTKNLSQAINFSLTVSDRDLSGVKNQEGAQKWFEENLLNCPNVTNMERIKYVALGDGQMMTKINRDDLENAYIPALNAMQTYLEDGKGPIAVIPFDFGKIFMTSSDNTPSNGRFRRDIEQEMVEIVRLLNATEAPFMLNLSPFDDFINRPDLHTKYLLPGNDHTLLRDGRFRYSNLVDVHFDIVVSALRGAGAHNMEIVIGEIGWPTDGHEFANPWYASLFYRSLVYKLSVDAGLGQLAPERSGNLFLHSMMDENKRSIHGGTRNFERHWGLMSYRGKPNVNFSLNVGENEFTGVMVSTIDCFPKRWCMHSGGNNADEKFRFACENGDCTSLGYNCHGLDRNGNVSYALNMYYQMSNQESCNGTLVWDNPSTENCSFPVQIIPLGNLGFRHVPPDYVLFGLLLLTALLV